MPKEIPIILAHRWLPLLALLGLALAAATHAAPVLHGRVTDVETGEELLGANLQLAEALRGTSSDAQGRYRLLPPHAGQWTLRVTHIGYRSQSLPFLIAEYDSLELNIALHSDYLQGDEVIVTAQARETTARLSTTKVDVVGAAEVEQRAPGTLDYVLDAVPGLEVHRTGGPVVSNLSIRGSSDMLGGGVGNRTLLLVDGRPAVISDTDGASWWLYPDDIIERVEVVKGAYSALYGSNAMGGVVNLITRTPQNREFTRIHATSGVYDRPPARIRHSERLAGLGSLAFSHSNSIGRFGYFTSATRRASDGWRASSSYDNVSVFTKLKYDLTPTRMLRFSGLYLTGENDYPHAWYSSAQPLRVRDIYTNDLQRKRSASLDAVYQRLESAENGYTVRLFYNRDLTRSVLNPASNPRDPAEDVPIGFETRSLSQKFGMLEQSYRRLPYANTLVFGMDAVWDVIDGQPASYLYGRQSAFSPAVYAQNDFSPVPEFHFTAGARFDYRHVAGGNTTHQLSPKFGLSYEARKDFVLRGSVGHAFRNPSIAEMFLKRVGTQDYEFVPNPDLAPETVNFGETGFNLRFADYATVDGAAFIYQYDQIIRWQTLAAGKFRTENLSHAEIKGFEIAVRTAWPRRIKQQAAVTYLNTDIDGKGPLTYVPEWRLFYSAGYEIGRTLLSGEVRYVGAIDSVIFYQNDAPDAYALINLRATMRFRQHTRLGFHIDNVTGVQYEEMERYRMPPRTYKVVLLYEFDVMKD